MKHSMINEGYSNIRRRTGFTKLLDENGRLPNGEWLSNTTENNILV
jgi:hypothetical protein